MKERVFLIIFQIIWKRLWSVLSSVDFLTSQVYKSIKILTNRFKFKS